MNGSNGIRELVVELSAVSKGATGIPVLKGAALEYKIPSGTPELAEEVASIRIMEPKLTGKCPYPDGYAVYMNKMGQTINPLNGQTISPSNPFSHIPLR